MRHTKKSRWEKLDAISGVKKVKVFKKKNVLSWEGSDCGKVDVKRELRMDDDRFS